MKKLLKVIVIFIVVSVPAYSQNIPDSTSENKWNFNAGIYFYFIPDDFFVLPVLKADKDKLHLEVRYNYEDRRTTSLWLGYNFVWGEEWELTFTPMISAVVGQSNGSAPGLEFDLTYNGFELYNEAEYLFNFEDGQSDYFYNWAELTYSPLDWLWFGIVGQRTRVYQTEVDIQRGLLLGASYKNLEITGYLFNIFSEDVFTVISLSTYF